MNTEREKRRHTHAPHTLATQKRQNSRKDKHVQPLPLQQFYANILPFQAASAAATTSTLSSSTTFNTCFMQTVALHSCIRE